MSSEIFENREEDFRSLIDEITNKLSVQAPKVTGEAKKKLIRDVERKIEDGRSLIREMESEMRKAPGQYRTQMTNRMKSYRRDIDQLSRELMGLGNVGASRSAVTFDTEDDFERMESAQRARLMQGNEILSRTSDSVGRSQQISAETDMIGHGIIDELGTQREQLERTRDRLTDTDSALVQSRKILKSMARRVMTNKLILIVIIILEVAVLGGLVYWKFFS